MDSFIIYDLELLQKNGIHPGLDTILNTLHLFGNPQRSFQSVHIAGTNGKGSTCTFVAQMLIEAGYKTGLTLSPHIQSVRERIQINGTWISEEDFARLHQLLKQKVGLKKHTYFEWIILIMFLYFAERQVDIAILETGLGGRWDATNVVTPLVSAITTVAMDHEHYLGNTLEKILIEKMQIIKGGEVWTGIDNMHLLPVLKKHCQSCRAIFHQIDKNILHFVEELPLGLEGEHQKRNAALAVGIIHSLNSLGFAISSQAIAAGLQNAHIEGRLETVYNKPQIVVDGAHNEEGILSLVTFLKTNPYKFHAFFGCLSDRPLSHLAGLLLPHVLSLTLVYFETNRMYPLETLQKEAKRLSQELGADIKVLNLQEIYLKKWLESYSQSDHIIITGSLYLVAQFKQALKTINV
ncbi:bifunctional folylpolyglutamate synthase/dihydrofolate synthase [bacterium]|nr:bifunctional folylpolyglutamate synthase/dihydrofolate synthase [bacterium]